MDTFQRHQTITRYRPSGVIPLELWDFSVNGRILWELMEHVKFPRILRMIIKMLRLGEGNTLSAGPVPQVIAGFDSLHVAGGRAGESKFSSALQALKLPVTVSPSPDYPGREQGLRLLASMGSTTGWVCDLGQTSFKIGANACQMRFQRNFEQLPGRRNALDDTRDKQRKMLRAWLSESICRFLAIARPPDGILFAMPSRLNDEGVPEASSYIGMEGDSALIADAISIAGVHPGCVLVVNDAELAAMEALAEEELQLCRKTLVVTLGFAMGAALAMRPVTGQQIHS
jgi:hypothetical protein